MKVHYDFITKVFRCEETKQMLLNLLHPAIIGDRSQLFRQTVIICNKSQGKDELELELVVNRVGTDDEAETTFK